MIESNCLEFFSRLHEILICGFEEKAQKPDFWPKMAKNGKKGPKTGKREFFSKIRLKHFSCFIKMQLCAKNHKNLTRGFLDMV